MATTTFVFSELEFVPNNYVAPLNTANAPEAFHLIQRFLTNSDIGHALTEPMKLSGSQIRAFWQTGVYDNGGEAGSPSIVFEYQNQEFVVTPVTVRDALNFEDFNSYTISVGDGDLLRMMREIGYSGSLTKVGQLKRPFLRKEWSFFFDCITRAFGKKCTNWDAIPTDSLQIGYSLLYGTHFDFARLVLHNIGEKMTENRGVVYFARFCQLLFSFCVPDIEIPEDDVIQSFRLHKHIFSDLTNKDLKKGNVGALLLPERVEQFENNPSQPQLHPAPEPQTLTTEPPLSTSQQPLSGGRFKKRALKRKVRAHMPKSNDEDTDDHEIIHQKKRRLVANYLFDDLDESTPDSEAVQHEAPKDFVEEHVVNTADEDMTFIDAEAPEVIVQEATENVAAASVPDLANADIEADFDQDVLFDDFDANVEAHPSISVCDTEDVAADQPTQILDESIATHTEILSVNNQIPELGEEVDQIVEAAIEQIDEAMAETLKETTVQTEEIIVESVPVETEVLANANSEIPEAAQPNAEVTADNVIEEIAEQLEENANEARVDFDNDDHTSVNSDHANSEINPELSNSDSHESLPFLRDPTTESIKENQNATEAHFREMHYANWSGADCIFSSQRAADFVNKTATEITNPELLSHFKATIVQVKSLHNRFDETHKVVLGLSNDIALKELALKKDRAQFSSMQKDQEEIKQRLTNVESNQTVMSSQLTSIAASLELLTSVFIPDDVKKGEKIPKDKCRRTPTLRLRDDSNDGGSRETEKRSKSSQEQGRLRSNSARQTNSDMINSGATGSGTHAQSSSRLKSLVISANPITDEEIAAKLFLDEHDGEVTVEDLEAEMKMLSEEHKKKVASGNYKKKSVKAPKKKEIGISIKENTQQSIQYTRRPVIANTDKGKGILVEEGQLPKKNYSTSDVAHVDISTKVVTTSDKAQVVQTQLAPQLKGFLRPVLSETLTLEPVDFSQTRTVLGKESYDKSGLGSHREKRINNRPLDQTSLAEAGIGVSQESLDKLESVQMVYHRGLKKEVLLYFMSDGRVYRVGEADVQLKLWEELEYVLYLLKVKNKSTHDVALVLKDRMMKSKVLLGGGVSSAYIPKYRDAYGKIVEMKRNNAKFKTALGIKVLEFNLESDKSYYIRLGNEMRKNNIYSLRAAIYQTGEGDPELKELKEIMVEELEKAERRLLIDYLRTVPDIEEIKSRQEFGHPGPYNEFELNATFSKMGIGEAPYSLKEKYLSLPDAQMDKLVRGAFHLGPEISWRWPRPGERIYHRPSDGYVGVWLETLRSGWNPRSHMFIKHLCKYVYKISIMQITPNGVKWMTWFLVACHKMGYQPTFRLFHQLFKLVQSNKEPLYEIRFRAEECGYPSGTAKPVIQQSTLKYWNGEVIFLKVLDLEFFPYIVSGVEA
ncbi:hypothetical protein POM88_035610 [Heracleum sosnowskyi]|uniref:Transposase (putative) gypsy type domain-containing protein n=1 Tax=Heracleum sosnowskyi TaxID=360622 RepID=A0AAD8HMP6_9APIA|nr:hypothetical protein POM88_035610 [Heracleum sosnowskyi]